jgi:hypothetical protein
MGGTVLFIIPGIIVALYVRMAIYTFILENKRGFEAVQTSYVLVKGRLWQYFVRLFAVGLIMAIVSIVIGMVIGSIISGKSASQNIVNLIAMSTFVPFFFVYEYNLFVAMKNTQSATEVSAPGKFKKWLIAFMTVGVVGMVATAIIVPIVIFTLAKTGLQNAQDMSKIQDAIRAQIEQAQKAQ